jgi:DNA-binding NarL/FixJ family response regulator
MSTPPLRVMVVDDHQVVRDGIKLLLADTDDVVVCAEAASARRRWPWPPAPSRT